MTFRFKQYQALAVPVRLVQSDGTPITGVTNTDVALVVSVSVNGGSANSVTVANYGRGFAELTGGAFTGLGYYLLSVTAYNSANSTLGTMSFAVAYTNAVTVKVDYHIVEHNEQDVIDAIPSAAAISDAVWDEAMSGHATAGTGGALLTAASQATGAGSELLTVTVVDDEDTAIEGVRVYAHAAGGALVGVATTDSNGEAVVTPGTGVITLTAAYAGYTFEPVEATVSEGVNQTADMEGLTSVISASEDPTLCTVYATLRGPDGIVDESITGTLEILSLPQEVEDSLVGGGAYSATSSGAGVISWDAPRGARVTVTIPGYFPSQSFVVPDAASYDISALA